MNPSELAEKLESVAGRLHTIRRDLEQLVPALRFQVDRKAANRIVTDLAWAEENCTVIGGHQVGRFLDDAMGMSSDGNVV